jgi:hypothetical protein
MKYYLSSFFFSMPILLGAILLFLLGQCTTFAYADQKLPSPLKQLESGVPLQYIACKVNFQLVTKSGANFPACVKLLSTSSLIERGWMPQGKLINIDGILDYETRKQGGHFIFCDLYSITINETEKVNLKTNSDKLLVYTNIIVHPDDSTEITYPGNNLKHELKGSLLQINGRVVDNHGVSWCPKLYTDNNGTFRDIISDQEPVMVPSEIEILNR